MEPCRESTAAHDQRAYERRTVLVAARIHDGEEWHECRIVNISLGGAKLRTGRRIDPGATVLLDIERFGRFSGTVVWRHSEELGITFTHNPDEVADMVMGLAIYG